MITDIPVKYTEDDEEAVIDTRPQNLDFPEPTSQEGLMKDPAFESRPVVKEKSSEIPITIEESEIDKVAEHIIAEQSKSPTGKLNLKNTISSKLHNSISPRNKSAEKLADGLAEKEKIPEKSEIVGNLYVSDEDWQEAIKDINGQSENDSDSKESDKKQKKLREIVLPEGLQRKVVTQYLAAAAIAIVTIVMLAQLREPQLTLGFVLSGVLIYNGISLTFDYDNDKVTEVAVLCATIRYNMGSRNTHVVFRTNDEIPKYFDFHVPGKHLKEFIPNYPYVIYFRTEAEKQLLGYTAL